jgi:N-acetylmuramoyl-L-alanine amidase
VVIDAGHGGHDAGAIGSFSEEKNINLSIALKLGSLIKNTFNDGVRVIFTRSTDVFIPLDRRAEIANNANADLFISVHTNSIPKGTLSPSGVETYSLGLARSEANLAVAKRENSAILLEKDYKTRYAGFDPNSPELSIIFEFMQDKNMKQSVHMASLVQQEIRSFAHRSDKGVKQAGFLVLRATAMPSVLVEVGFISNLDEENYLNSDSGSNAIAESVFRAFCEYKHEDDLRHNRKGVPYRPVDQLEPILKDSITSQKQVLAPRRKRIEVKKKVEEVECRSDTQIVFKIQIVTSPVQLRSNSAFFKGLVPSGNFHEGGLYKYTYGDSTNYYAVCKIRREVLLKFKDAFIIAFQGDKKININEAISEFKRLRK